MSRRMVLHKQQNHVRSSVWQALAFERHTLLLLMVASQSGDKCLELERRVCSERKMEMSGQWRGGEIQPNRRLVRGCMGLANYQNLHSIRSVRGLGPTGLVGKVFS